MVLHLMPGFRRAASRGVGRNPEELLQSVLLKPAWATECPGRRSASPLTNPSNIVHSRRKPLPRGFPYFPARPEWRLRHHRFFRWGSTPKADLVPRKWDGKHLDHT